MFFLKKLSGFFKNLVSSITNSENNTNSLFIKTKNNDNFIKDKYNKEDKRFYINLDEEDENNNTNNNEEEDNKADDEENEDDETNFRDKNEEIRKKILDALDGKGDLYSVDAELWNAITSERNLNREVGGMEEDYETKNKENEKLIDANRVHIKAGKVKNNKKFKDANNNNIDDELESVLEKAEKRIQKFKKLKKILKGLLPLRAIKKLSRSSKNIGVLSKQAKKTKKTILSKINHKKRLEQKRKKERSNSIGIGF